MLEGQKELEQIIWLAPQAESADSLKEQERNVLHVFKLMKALLALGYGEKRLDWCIVTANAQPFSDQDSADPSQAAVSGLAGTMAKEYPHWHIRMIDTETDGSWPIEEALSLSAGKNGQIWAYRNQQLFERQLIPLDNMPKNGTLYQTGGVYAVIGGAGYHIRRLRSRHNPRLFGRACRFSAYCQAVSAAAQTAVDCGTPKFDRFSRQKD